MASNIFMPPNAFTLIELLIVVAIISILAAITTPNLHDAMIRAKITRTKADMHTMLTAIEIYKLEHRADPYRRSTKARSNATQSITPYVPEATTRLAQLKVLTTPLPYIHDLPVDLFETFLLGNNVIDYYDPVQCSWLIRSRLPGQKDIAPSPNDAGYLLVSVGPDRYLGVIGSTVRPEEGRVAFDDNGWPSAYIYNATIYVPYDPTNGSISTGNIYSGLRKEATSKYLMSWFFRTR